MSRSFLLGPLIDYLMVHKKKKKSKPEEKIYVPFQCWFMLTMLWFLPILDFNSCIHLCLRRPTSGFPSNGSQQIPILASLFEPGFCHIHFSLNLDFYQVCPALFIQVNGGRSIYSWDRKGICDYNQRLTLLLGKGSSDVDTCVHHCLLLSSTLP